MREAAMHASRHQCFGVYSSFPTTVQSRGAHEALRCALHTFTLRYAKIAGEMRLSLIYNLHTVHREERL